MEQVKFDESLNCLKSMAASLSAEATVLHIGAGQTGNVAEVLIRHYPSLISHSHDDGDSNAEISAPAEVRVAVIGNVDAGKSTLLGVLVNGVLDTGRGLARSSVFVHRHEVETGRTSSIASVVLGYDSVGNTVNYRHLNRGDDVSHQNGAYDMAEVVKRSAKVVSFFDMAGHERYFRTTVSGLSGRVIDYAMLVVGGNHGTR